MSAELSNELVAARSRYGHTLHEAASAIGVDTGTVWRWENSEQTPTGLSLAALERYIAGCPAIEAARTDRERP